MRTGNRFAEILGAVFGTGFGAGMALQLTLFSLGGVFIGLCGYAFLAFGTQRILCQITILLLLSKIVNLF